MIKPIVIFAVALALRLIHIWQIRRSPFFDVLFGDARSYDQWAQRLAGGDWIGHDVFYQAPLYPYFLGLMYWTAGRSLLLVRVVQAVIGSCSCVFVYAAGRRLFSERIGTVAGLMLAVYAPVIFSEGLLQKSVLDVFFVSLALWLLTRTPPRWLALGLTIAGLSLTRENALVFVVIILAWAVFRFGLRSAAWFTAGVSIVLLPVIVRSSIVGGGFYVTTAQFGPNFFIGNHSGADGRYQSLRYGRGSPEYERRDATELAEHALQRKLTPAEVSSFWTHRVLAFIKSSPGAWLRLMGRKIVLLVNATEVADTEDQATYAEWSTVLALLGPVTHFGVLIPLALVGILSTWSARSRAAILYALLVAYACSVVMFYVVERYRYPLVPMLIMFAAPGIFAMGRVRLRVPVVPVAAVAAVTIFVNWPIGSVNAMRAVTETNLGAALQSEQRRDDAILHYRRAIAAFPDYAPAYSNLGIALREQNRIDEAAESYSQALRLEPEFATAHYNFANLLLDKGEPEAAVDHFERAIRKEPASADVHSNLGMALALTGRIDEALREFRRAIALDPASLKAYRNLGNVLASQGRLVDAISALRQAVELNPSDADVRYDLASTLLESGSLDEAIFEFRTALRLAPAMIEARNNLGIALGSQGKLDEAIEEFRRALAVQPGFVDAQQNLARALAARRATARGAAPSSPAVRRGGRGGRPHPN